MLRDKLLDRLSSSAEPPDHQRLAADVLGIRNAPPELARKLVAQALVLEDRREEWRAAGERICRDAPATAGVYVLRDDAGAALYVGKAIHLRRRLRTHFADRRWRAIKPQMARAAAAEWIEVGSELEALLRERALIAELRPAVNVQIAAPDPIDDDAARSRRRDVIVVVPSVEDDSAELVAARPGGAWMIQRTRRNGADLAVHAARLWKFFRARASSRAAAPFAPIVYGWLAHRGQSASRIDPRDASSARVLATRLAALLRDERLFHERLEQY